MAVFDWPNTMDDLIKLVRTYRHTEGMAERIRLAEEIFRLNSTRFALFRIQQHFPSRRRGRDAGNFEGGCHQLKKIPGRHGKGILGVVLPHCAEQIKRPLPRQSHRPDAANAAGRPLANDRIIGTGRANHPRCPARSGICDEIADGSHCLPELISNAASSH